MPLAWAQNYSIRCNNDEAIVLNASFIVRDSDTGEDLVEYNGSQAALSASGTRGSSGQTTATMSGASVAFAVPLSPPATSGELERVHVLNHHLCGSVNDRTC